MDAITAIKGKRDTRSYTDSPIDEETLNSVLDAARMAGSAKNVQPVRLVVTTDPAKKVALKDSGDFASWIDDAPVVIVVTVRADAGPRSMFDVGRHAQNLMVAAHASGLASCPVTIHHAEVAHDVLAIPTDVIPAMIVTLGWPAPSTAPSPVAGPRVDIREYVSTEGWD